MILLALVPVGADATQPPQQPKKLSVCLKPALAHAHMHPCIRARSLLQAKQPAGEGAEAPGASPSAGGAQLQGHAHSQQEQAASVAVLEQRLQAQAAELHAVQAELEQVRRGARECVQRLQGPASLVACTPLLEPGYTHAGCGGAAPPHLLMAVMAS